MSMIGGQVRFQPRRGANIPVNAPQDFRFAGEPEEGSSEQMQSWQRAGQGFTNWLQSEPFGFFKDIGRGVADLYGRAQDWYGENVFPYTPGARIAGVPRPDSWLTRPLFGGGEPTPTQAIIGARGEAPPKQPMQEPAGLTFQEWAAANMIPFDSTPFDTYAATMAQLDEETLARINAMYAQLAESAAENVQRVQDIYGGAEAGVGETYAGSEQAVADAYSSAQQQAADQLARLGIEQAAPAVVNPMALSQAESLSNIAANRASGLGAVERFGATGQDFASQMAQVGQQQGLEVTSQILRDMARRQAEMALRRSEAEAAYDPYSQAMRRLEAESAYNQMVNPQPNLEDLEAQAKFEYGREQDDIDNFWRSYEFYLNQTAGNQDESYRAALTDAATGMFGRTLQLQAQQQLAEMGQ